MCILHSYRAIARLCVKHKANHESRSLSRHLIQYISQLSSSMCIFIYSTFQNLWRPVWLLHGLLQQYQEDPCLVSHRVASLCCKACRKGVDWMWTGYTRAWNCWPVHGPLKVKLKRQLGMKAAMEFLVTSREPQTSDLHSSRQGAELA